MAKGKIRKKDEKPSQDLPFVDDQKIRRSLLLMFDKFNENARQKIIDTYNDRKLLQSYEDIRRSGLYQEAHGKAHHRKILEFPNPEVFEFVNTVMTSRFGDNWLENNKALRDPLCRAWWVIKKL